MEKNNNKGAFIYIVSFVVLAVLWLASIILFACSVISIVPFLIWLVLNTGLIFIIIFAYKKFKQRQIEKLKKVELVSGSLSEEDLINLYNLAGIPVIRDENGKIKNIYELLALEILYDTDGNRIKTIYELLGIVPRFDKNGKEIPTVLSIKNRAGAFVKPKMQAGILTRVLTEQEKEDLLVKQMLEEKLKQAKEAGDDKKAKAITKVIGAKKKEVKKSSPSKTPKIILAKGKAGKVDKVGAIKSSPSNDFFKDIIALAGIRNKKEKSVFAKPEDGAAKKKPFEGFRMDPQTGHEQHKPRVLPSLNAFYGDFDLSTYQNMGKAEKKKNPFMDFGNEQQR